MRKKKSSLMLERLEDRTVLTTAANLWPDATHLTLSFVPDGTNVSGASSNLFSSMNAAFGSTAAWQQSILKAFQTWAAQSNINIAVVADGGQPLGTAGAMEGDPRFGDIRIAEAPEATTAVATGTLPSIAAGTWSGDLVFNSNYQFGSGSGQYDLSTVAMHEAGHIFGLVDNPTDTTSAMYAQYIGPRSGLNAADIAALQAEYGLRPLSAAANMPASQNGQKGKGGNNKLQVEQLSSTASLTMTVAADLSAVGETDYYAFQVDKGSHPAGINIQLQTANLSSLTATLSIYNADMQLVATASAADPMNGNLNINLGNVNSGDQYYVEVQGASGNVFDVGTYQLTVNLQPQSAAALSQQVLGHNQDLHAQNTTASAPSVVASGTITAANSTFLYKLQAPKNVTGGVNVYLSGWGPGVVAPSLSLFDSTGNLLAVTNAPDANGVLSLNLSALEPNGQYYIEVASGVSSATEIGAFRLQADLFQTQGPASTPAMVLLVNSPGQPNTAIPSATNLQNVAPPAPKGSPAATIYEVVDSIGTGGSVLYYKVQLPKSNTQTTAMIVTVLAENAQSLAPQVTVYDQQNNVVSSGVVLANGNGTFAVQFANINQGGNYTIAVSSGPTANGPGVGNFFLNVSFQTTASAALQVTGDTLSAAQAQEFRTLTVVQNGLYSFSLTAAGTGAAQVQMFIYDSAGNLIWSQFANAGQAATTSSVYLSAGNYTVQFLAIAQSGTLNPLTFGLTVQMLSDPLGPQPVGTSGSGTSGTGTSGSTDGSTYVMSGPSATSTGLVSPDLNPYFYTY